MRSSFQRKTIWVIDDMEDAVYLFMSALRQRLDYRLECVPNVRDAHPTPGDIVFLDLNGTDSELFNAPEGVQVVRMTGGVDAADIHKPFTSQELRELMEHILTPSAKKAA